MNADTNMIFKLKPEIDTMMVTSQKNRMYFTGFNSTFGILLLNARKNIFITDNRYSEMAAGIKNAEVRSGTAAAVDGMLKEALAELNAQSVGFEDGEITVRTFEKYKKLSDSGKISLLPASHAIDEMRLVKSAGEIETISRAQQITDNAFNEILKFIKPGVTEAEIANELERLLRYFGGGGPSFEIIVAAGVNGSMPHAHPSDKKVKRGEGITMDFGAKLDGYRSDMTRTVFLGKPDPEMEKIYGAVLEAQETAIRRVRAGVKGKELDAAAREVLRAKGLESNFIHALGHGLGLDIHEEPSLNPNCETALRTDMVITIEPGVYVPGLGGVRIEDMLAVKEDGCINLTNSLKNIIIL